MRDAGAVVSLAGTVEPADDVVKLHASALDTFRSPNGGSLGRVGDDRVVRYRRRGRRRHVTTDRAAARVHLITATVAMDGSLLEDMKTPASYAYNCAVTARVVEMAHAVGVSVEGELGCLGSLESGLAGEEDGSGAEGKLHHDQLLTDPEQAADFVAQTGVDALAIAIGTSHGAYKFSRAPTGDLLAIDRIADERELVFARRRLRRAEHVVHMQGVPPNVVVDGVERSDRRSPEVLEQRVPDVHIRAVDENHMAPGAPRVRRSNDDVAAQVADMRQKVERAIAVARAGM